MEARKLGFLGPGPVDAHLDHAAGFAEIVQALASPGAAPWPALAADLGSGAGLPGLPLALALVHCRWLLVDSSVRRSEFLRTAVRRLGIADRVTVAQVRAETLGRDIECRGRLDLVVARSFGPPAAVAECAAPLLAVGGRAVVSEPPGGVPARWPPEGLAELGLAPAPPVSAGGWSFQILHQQALCADRYPRRIGVPVKRPLF